MATLRGRPATTPLSESIRDEGQAPTTDRRSARRAGGARGTPAPGPGLARPARQALGAREGRPGEAPLDVAIVGGGMAGLALLATLTHLGLRARIYDRSPAGFEGPLGHDRAHGDAALAQGTHRPCAGPAGADLSRLVRGPVRVGGLGRARQDPAPAVGRVPALVSQRAGPRRAQRTAGAGGAAARRRRGCSSTCWTARPMARAYTIQARTWCSPPAATSLGGAWVPDGRLRCRAIDGPVVRSWDRRQPAPAGGSRSSAAAHSAMDAAASALEAGAGRVGPADPRADLPPGQQGQGAGNPRWCMASGSCPTNGNGACATASTSSGCRRRTAARCACRARMPRRHMLGTSVLGAVRRADGALRARTPARACWWSTSWSSAPAFAPTGRCVRELRSRRRCGSGRTASRRPRAGRHRTGPPSPDLGAALRAARRRRRLPGPGPRALLLVPAALSHGHDLGRHPAAIDGARRLAQGIAELFYREGVERTTPTWKRFRNRKCPATNGRRPGCRRTRGRRRPRNDPVGCCAVPRKRLVVLLMTLIVFVGLPPSATRSTS